MHERVLREVAADEPSPIPDASFGCVAREKQDTGVLDSASSQDEVVGTHLELPSLRIGRRDGRDASVARLRVEAQRGGVEEHPDIPGLLEIGSELGSELDGVHMEHRGPDRTLIERKGIDPGGGTPRLHLVIEASQATDLLRPPVVAAQLVRCERPPAVAHPGPPLEVDGVEGPTPPCPEQGGTPERRQTRVAERWVRVTDHPTLVEPLHRGLVTRPTRFEDADPPARPGELHGDGHPRRPRTDDAHVAGDRCLGGKSRADVDDHVGSSSGDSGPCPRS